jgi:hypothetical protein
MSSPSYENPLAQAGRKLTREALHRRNIGVNGFWGPPVPYRSPSESIKQLVRVLAASFHLRNQTIQARRGKATRESFTTFASQHRRIRTPRVLQILRNSQSEQTTATHKNHPTVL